MRLTSIVLVILGLCALDSAWAAGVGGGGRGMGGGMRRNREDREREQEAKKEKETAEKPALPASVELAALDSTLFDSISASLNLTDAQKPKIEKAKTDIEAERQKLLTNQEESRKTYEEATTAAEVSTATNKVLSAIAACKLFNAKARFETALAGILTVDQRQKYRAASLATRL